MDNMEISGKPRPFKIIDGRKWVLAEDEPWDESDAQPENLALIPSPPREIPFAVRLHLRYGSGAGGTFGLMFGAFGLMFALVATHMVGLDDAIPRVWTDAGVGKITRIEDMRLKVNETPYYRFHFTATDADGKPVSASVKAPRGKRQEGDEVALERSGRRFRIKGMRTAYHVWPFLGIGTLFGCVGLGIAGYSFFTGGRKIRLLRDGEAVAATYLGMESTNFHVNNQTVMKITFEYTVDGEPHTTVARTLDPDRLIDGTGKIALYDPFKPGDAIILESLPTGIKIDEVTGRFHTSFLAVIFPLLLTFVAIGELAAIVHGLIAAIF